MISRVKTTYQQISKTNMRFENSELRTFKAVVEAGGFKRAAEVLHVSQSAVSQSVAGLENKLEMILLERGRTLRLTDAGRRLFKHAAEVLQEEQRALEDLAMLKQGRLETLSLALSAAINRFYAPQLMSAYYQENPQARLKLSELPSRNIIHEVLSGNAELGLGPFQRQMQAFQMVPLYEDSRHLVVSPRHPQFEAMMAGDERALRRTPLITSALDHPEMRPSIQRLRDQFSTVWEVSSLMLRVHMVSEGMGVAFIDGKLLDEHPPCGDFRIMNDLSFGRIDKQVGLYYRADTILSDSARRFVALCQRFWSQ